MSELAPITTFWLDARIHRLLARPEMWFMGPEALFNVVFELLVTRGRLTGERFSPTIKDMDRLGLKDGARYIIPETITEEFVQELRTFAREKGYDPRDFDERDEAVSEHVRACPLCKTRWSTKIEQCTVIPKLDQHTSGYIAEFGPFFEEES